MHISADTSRIHSTSPSSETLPHSLPSQQILEHHAQHLHLPRAASIQHAYAHFKAYIAFAAVCCIWGSTYLGVRFAIETLPPLLMAGVRFTIAGLIMLIWARASGAQYPRWAECRSAAFVGFMLVTACNGMFTLAMGRVPSSLGALIATSLPIWTILLDWLHPSGQRPSLGVWIGVSVGFLGIILLVQPWNYDTTARSSSPQFDYYGIFLLFAGTIAWAIGSLYARVSMLPQPPRMATALQLLSGGLTLLIASCITGDWRTIRIESVSIKSLTAFLYLIVFGSIVAFTAYSWLLHHTSAAFSSSYTYINPIIAVLLGASIGGERITANMIVAMIIILIAVAVIARYRSIPASQ
ncbi:MAG: EamA family transporter [Bacteroidota bacterium]|nr:EamA family transporter [Candidatus Kapabacteria bacterium]MDW8220237.1 EamA family transporter [Bacteroidota bacterium]